ncbi:hypothetical protein PSY76_23705 [Shigella flexneri]|nr:hypothetical protein [Shigella flexneri]
MFKQNIVNGSQKESPDYWLPLTMFCLNIP